MWCRASVRLLVLAVLAAAAAGARAQDLRTDEGREEPDQFATGAARAHMGILDEPRVLADAINSGFERFGETGTPGNGAYVELSNMITGSGFISVGPGYRHQLLNNNAFVDVSAAVSWRLYNMMQGRFEMPDLADRHVSIGTQVMWQDQTQINYFGTGSASLRSDQSQYRMQSVDSVAYVSVKPVRSLSIGGEYGFLRRPDILTPSGTFKPEVPTTSDLFPAVPGVAAPFQPNYLHGEASIASDTRDHRSRPTRGGLYRLALVTFDDRTDGTFSFRQYEAEGAQFIRLNATDWIIALHGWTVTSDVAPGHDIPFYLLPTLGGQNSLRSYDD